METGAGDCFSFWLPVRPVTTTSFSFTSVSVMGWCLTESLSASFIAMAWAVADVHKLVSNIDFNTVFICFLVFYLFTS